MASFNKFDSFVEALAEKAHDLGWWDYGSEVTLASGETFTVNFGASVLTLA